MEQNIKEQQSDAIKVQYTPHKEAKTQSEISESGLPSQTKQLEYIYLTLKKQEKRFKISLFSKWSLRLAILIFIILFYQNKELIINNYILPEVMKNVNSTLGQSNPMINQGGDINEIMKQYSESGAMNNVSNNPSINEEQKKTILQNIKDTQELYKTLTE